MLDRQPITKRPWAIKFRDAFRGIKAGIRGQSSFFIHFFMAAAVLIAAMLWRANLVEWSLLLLCISIVLTAEMFNSALETMAKAISAEDNPHLRDSLNIGSAAVLLAACGAAIVGGLIFINRLG
ncbi:MAG: diacylglycerol kinase, partial [Thermoguttaceae bacterium]